MIDMQQSLGRAIAGLRKTAQLTQEQLSELSGVGQTDISKIENGKQGLTNETLIALAAGLTVPVSRVWSEAEAICDGVPAISAKQRLTEAGSSKPASQELMDRHRLPNDIKALQWINGALIGFLVATLPNEAGGLATALSALPEAYRSTGPGGALLSEVEAIQRFVAEAVEPKGAKPRGKRPASPRSRS